MTIPKFTSVEEDLCIEEPKPHAFVYEWSAESPYCGALVMRNGDGDTCGERRGHPSHAAAGKR